MPRRFQRFWKEEEMLHHGKHAPVPILRPVAHFVHKFVKFLSLNICYLCSIVNKILAYVIWNFIFHFIQI